MRTVTVIENIVYVMEGLNIISVVVRVMLAMLCGGILGLERGKYNQPAGMRTHMLVCLGAAVVMMTGQFVYMKFGEGDPSRLGAQVISGIGFLGAGSIIVEGGTKVRGLTTAAGLWVSACIGIAIGIGFYSVSIIATGVVYIIISKFKMFSHHYVLESVWFGLYVEFKKMKSLPEFYKAAEKLGVTLGNIQVKKMRDDGSCIVVISVKDDDETKVDELLDVLKHLHGVIDLEMIELT